MKSETRADVQAGVGKMFARLDTNHDGFVDKDEIAAVQAKRQQRMEQRAQRFDPSKIFAKLDLPVSDKDHRRVLAVLRFLES